MIFRRARALAGVLALALAPALAGCGDDDGDDGGGSWETIHTGLDSGLLSVWGSGPDDVWVVGGDPDQTLANNGPAPPLVMHWDGAAWETLDPGVQASLWWVFGFDGGPVYIGGEGSTILRYQDGAFTEMETPGESETVYGIWGCSPDDVWAVGGEYGGAMGGFAWRLEGDAWVAAAELPADEVENDAIWKVHGRSCDDVWFVGTRGLALHWDGTAFERVSTGLESESLFTVACNSSRCVAVGGFGSGIILENDGSGWTNSTPEAASGVIGVCLTEDVGYAVGAYGEIHRSEMDGTWTKDETAIPFGESLHACWTDGAGGWWAVGGQVQQYPLERGVTVYKGDSPPRE